MRISVLVLLDDIASKYNEETQTPSLHVDSKRVGAHTDVHSKHMALLPAISGARNMHHKSFRQFSH